MLNSFNKIITCRAKVQKAKKVRKNSIKWLYLSSLNSAFFTHRGVCMYLSLGLLIRYFKKDFSKSQATSYTHKY